ncbi:NAD(P)/FAD-dependent oxidoreductase [Ekhidna sp.]|uniref:NAD(P)/FAD-dependent oxidoreductase n=1 Tax=Ekhidna sp. TaxID=2608089 RepID=UPI0032EF77B9
MAIPSHLRLTVPETQYPRIVIIGGGFAGLRLAKSLKKVKAQVVMLDRNNFHTFQPLLYQVATAGLEPDSISGPLRKSFEGHFNYVFRMVKVTGVDFDNNEVITKVGNLKYDYLVIANGSATNYFGKENFREKVLPLKRVVHALDLRSHILQNFEQAELTQDPELFQQMMNIVVVGGGPTGVEVAGALAELRNHILPKDHPDLDFSKMNIYLIEGLDRLLNGMSDFAGKEALKYLKKMGVDVRLNTMVKDYENGIIDLGDEEIKAETLIWAAGVKGRIIEGIDAEKVQKSRILVDEYNRVKGMDNVFAIGDVAMMQTEELPNGHPMLAPVAIQQGEHLAKNIKRMFESKELMKFDYFDKGTMATVGRNKAVVDMPGGLHFKGFFAWLVWMFVHIMYLIGFRNKLITLNNWIWSYFTYDKGTRLIIRTFSLRSKKTLTADRKISG